jgi:Mn-dependent DtxR family transcriptional regulator
VDQTEQLSSQIEDLKRLIILLLAKLGSDSGEIAMALQIDPSGVRKMIQMRQVKKIVPYEE